MSTDKLQNVEPDTIDRQFSENGSEEQDSKAPSTGMRKWLAFMEQGTAFGCFLNFTKCNIGSGVLSYPLAMRNAGWVLDVIILLLITVFSAITVRYNAMTLDFVGVSSYEELSQTLIGRWFKVLTILLLLIGGVGSCISYVVVVGDVYSHLETLNGMPELLCGTSGERLVRCLFWAVIIFPLTLLKHIDALRYTSFLGLTAVIYLLFCVIAMSGEKEAHWDSKNIPTARFDIKMILSIPLAIFGFSVQTTCFPLFRELKKKTINRITWISFISCFFTSCIYVIFGLAGSARYGSKVKGNILLNFKPTKYAYEGIACLLFIFNITFTFPVIIYVSRVAILQFFDYNCSDAAPFHVWFTIAGVLSLLCCVLGLYAPGIEIIFGFLGGITGSTLYFIWPCLFLLMTKEYTVEKVGKWRVALVWLILILGILSGVFGTFAAIYSMIKS